MKGSFQYSLAILTIAIMILMSSSAIAQSITGEITGTVTDSTGAVVSNATVKIVNQGTQVSRTALTNDGGGFTFTFLQPGSYTIAIDVPGFQPFKAADLKVGAGDKSRLDANLKVGSTSEAVQVEGTVPLLQTDSSSVGSSLLPQAVAELPILDRNITNLVILSPGISEGRAGSIVSGSRPDDRRQSSSIAANGQREYLNSNLLDGMDNNERHYGLIGVRPSVDAIGEVRVDTNTFTAEVGRSAGAIVNVITKSGTNDFHGSLYEYFRNDALNANDAISKKSGQATPKYNHNQYGGSLGGPIIKNKTFFFADWEQYRIVQGISSPFLTVPTKYEFDNPGDFTDCGGFALPTVALNTTALKIFKMLPYPNVPGAGCINNYHASPSRRQNSMSMDFKVDHHFSTNDAVFVRYSYNPIDSQYPGNYPAVDGISLVGAGFVGDGSFPGPNRTVTQGTQINYTHIFTPQLLMELRAGFTRINIKSYPYNYGTNAAEKLGIPNVNLDQYSSFLPTFRVLGYTDFGDQMATPILNVGNTFQYNGNVTYSKGRHNLKTGAALVRRQLNYLQEFNATGWYWYFGPAPITMLNFLTDGSVMGPGATMVIRNYQPNFQYMRSWEPSFYIQDDWRVTNWLTLNLGLRHDVYTPWTEKYNHLANFNPTTAKMFVASDSDPAAGVKTDYKNFAPRIGFAAQLGKGIVLRGGYGISYYPGDYGNAILTGTAPFATTITCFPGTPFAPCPGNSGSLVTGPPVPVLNYDINNPVGDISAKQFNWRSAYLQQFNLIAQKQFGENVITLGYIGSLGRRQALHNRNLNTPAPSSTPGVQNPKPYQSVLPGVNNISYFANEGTSNYSAMQARFERRFAKGFNANLNWTWSHGLGTIYGADTGGSVGLIPSNPKIDYGNSDLDLRHRISGSLMWQLPWFKSATGVKAGFLKGWSVMSTGYWQSGSPFTVINSNGRINTSANTTDRPNIVGSWQVSDPSPSKWFNAAAFQPQAWGTMGSERVNLLLGPTTRDVDLAVSKQFEITERTKLQFRTEIYNLTNTINWGMPNPDINDPRVGTIDSTRMGTSPRQFQFALKLLF